AYGPIHRATALRNRMEVTPPEEEKTGLPWRFASRHLRGMSVQWTGLMNNPKPAAKYLKYICDKWNNRGERSKGRNARIPLPTDLMTVTLQAVASMGYMSSKPGPGGWLGGHWVSVLDKEKVVTASYQCIQSESRAQGPILKAGKFEKKVARAMITIGNALRNERKEYDDARAAAAGIVVSKPDDLSEDQA
ncbi:hypothetical protein AAMO2058_001754200, partial [Amorphochlora amoebiformis]